uniref:Uncharacterized protein n=1 Tax=Arundo donax TaxID=35708 RepID=A0A0A9BX82_ARUDO
MREIEIESRAERAGIFWVAALDDGDGWGHRQREESS